MWKPFTIVGVYPDGESFVDCCDAHGPLDAKALVLANRPETEVIAVFAGEHKDLLAGIRDA